MFQKRINKVQKKLLEQKLDALLITSVSNISYLTGVTHFSKEEREAYILVTKTKLYIFTDKRYTDSLTDLSHMSVEEISHQFSFSDRLIKILNTFSIQRLGFESDSFSYAELICLKKKLSKITKLIPTAGIIEHLRIIKDNTEIDNLRKAAALTDQTFTHILSHIKHGVTEQELSADIKYFIEKHGGGIAFEPIVAFGKNSAIPHHHTSDQRLTAKNSIILLDFAASWNSYCADMTRTIFFGKATPEFKNMYETVRAAQEKAIQYLIEFRPRNKSDLYASSVDQIARDYIISQGFPSIPHSTGHGIGLQVHELPSVSPKDKTKLKPGMVITVEPGIYNPKMGGVRIEDDVLITGNGCEFLTKSDKNLIQL
jgi:Xaa-Pro aminopeptidase